MENRVIAKTIYNQMNQKGEAEAIFSQTKPEGMNSSIASAYPPLKNFRSNDSKQMEPSKFKMPNFHHKSPSISPMSKHTVHIQSNQRQV